MVAFLVGPSACYVLCGQRAQGGVHVSNLSGHRRRRNSAREHSVVTGAAYMRLARTQGMVAHQLRPVFGLGVAPGPQGPGGAVSAHPPTGTRGFARGRANAVRASAAAHKTRSGHPTSGLLTANVLEATKEERQMEEALTSGEPVVAGTFEHRLAQCRALLLDVSFRPIDVLSWQRAITLELFDKAEVLAYYDLAVRSARQSHQLPAVLKVNVFLSQAKAGRITATRRNILIRDRYTCQYCTAAGESVDHVLPLSRGGDWSWTNLVCACNRCNAKKGARTPAEANMPLRRMPKEPNGRSALYSRLGYATLVDSPPAEWEGYI